MKSLPRLLIAIPVTMSASLCAAQQLTDKVTFAAPAGIASKVVDQLGKAAGVKLRTGQATANDILLVSVTGVPLNELMDRVAAADDATWEKEKDGYLLTRTHPQEKAEIDAEVDDRALRLKMGIKGLFKDIDPKPWDDEAAAKFAKRVIDDGKLAQTQLSQPNSHFQETMRDMTLNTPSGRALLAFLSSIEPKTLAKIAPRTRVVFSTTSTSVQQPMPGATGDILARFLHEQRLFAENAKRLEEGTEKSFALGGSGTASIGPGDLSLEIGNATIISTGILGGPIQFNLTITDSKNQKIGSSSIILNPAKPSETIAGTSDTTPIEFSDVTKELASLISSPNRPNGPSNVRMGSKTDSGKSATVAFSSCPDGTEMPRPSQKLRAVLLHPDEVDPMSLAPAEGILAAAADRKENVIARFSDSAFVPIFSSISKGATVGTFLTQCSEDWEMRIKEGDGWLIVTPRQPVHTYTNRIDRKGLGETLRTLDKRGYLSLADVGAYALTQPKAPGPLDMDGRYLELINPAAAFKQLPLFGDWAMIRFYGSLSETQRGSLSNQTQVPLLNLSQAQINLLSDMVFNSFDGPFVGSPSDPKAKTEMAGFNDDPAAERTNVLPNGVVTGGSFSVAKSQSNGIYAQNTATGSTAFLNIEEVANQKVLSETSEPLLTKIVGHAPKFDRFQPAGITTYDFVFLFSKNVSFHRTLHDANPLDTFAAGAYDSLPEAFRKNVDDMSVDLRQAFKNLNFSGTGSKVPPPWSIGQPLQGQHRRLGPQ